MIPYGRQDINQDDIDAVSEVLRSNFPEFSIQEDSATGKRSWVNVISFGIFGDKDIPAPSDTE